MRSSLTWVAGRIVLAAALLVGAAGCLQKKAPPAPPPPPPAPPVSPSSMTPQPQLPSMPPPSEKSVGAPGSDQPAEKPPETPPPAKHTRRVKKHPATPDSTPATAQATAPPPASSAAAPPAAAPPAAAQAEPAQPSLGQLSAGRVADSRESAEMIEAIHAQEVRLGSIKRPMNEDSEAITAQIRAFLDKARDAVKENDLDGARTLTTKAKVLLDELSGS